MYLTISKVLSHIKQGTSKMEPCFCLWIFYPLRDFLPSPPPVFPSCKKEVPEVQDPGSYINPRRRKMKLSKMGRRAESWWRCIGGGRKCCLACTHRWLVTVTGSGTWDGSPPTQTLAFRLKLIFISSRPSSWQTPIKCYLFYWHKTRQDL